MCHIFLFSVFLCKGLSTGERARFFPGCVLGPVRGCKRAIAVFGREGSTTVAECVRVVDVGEGGAMIKLPQGVRFRHLSYSYEGVVRQRYIAGRGKVLVANRKQLLRVFPIRQYV